MPVAKTKKPVIKKSTSRRAIRSRAPIKRQSLLRPHLVHHRHSFKLLPRQHTDYPLLVYLLLLIGIFTTGWTAYAAGDDYQVQAIISAAQLATPAVITHPTNGLVVKTFTITVTGTCPNDSYIKLYKNDEFSGAALCQANNTWYIQTSLAVGSNKLFAQDYNHTDLAGPSSNAVTVTYEPDTSATTPSYPAPKPSAALFGISSEYTYRGVYAGQPFTQELLLFGGEAPYAVSIDWGDGASELSSHKSAGIFRFTHTYTQPGSYENSYIIKITGTDANGQTSMLQVVAIITPNQQGSGDSDVAASGITGSNGASGTGQGTLSNFWRFATPVYAVTVVSVFSFWLGEMHSAKLFGGHFYRPRWHH
jgi:hypothetical protein